MEEAEAQRDEAAGPRSHNTYTVELRRESSFKAGLCPPGVEEQLVGGGIWGPGPTAGGITFQLYDSGQVARPLLGSASSPTHSGGWS